MTKVEKLEKTLQNFRAEVDFKFKILQQILSNRTAQVAVLKDLLEREHALSMTLLGQWKKAPVLAANGHSLDPNLERNSSIKSRSKKVDSENDEIPEEFSGLLSRRRGTITRSKTRSQRARKRRKKSSTPEQPSTDEDDDGENCEAPPYSDIEESFKNSMGNQEYSEQNEMKEEEVSYSDINQDTETTAPVDQDQNYESDSSDCIPEGEKVYVEYEDTIPSHVPYDPVWKNFLIDDNSETVLCKLCDKAGVQKIMKVVKRTTSFLHNHLKLAHGKSKYKGTITRTRQIVAQGLSCRQNSCTILRRCANCVERIGSDFPCPKCDRRFNSYTSMRKHLREACETGPTRFICTICSSVLKWRRNIICHLRTVHKVACTPEDFTKFCRQVQIENLTPPPPPEPESESELASAS